MKTVMFLFILPICLFLTWLVSAILTPLMAAGGGMFVAFIGVQLVIFIGGAVYGYCYRKVTRG